MKTVKFKINRYFVVFFIVINLFIMFILSIYKIYNNFSIYNYLRTFNIKDYKILIKENNNLNKKVISYNYLKDENISLSKKIDDLNKLLNIKTYNSDIIYSNVVLRKPSYWSDFLIIDKGYKDSIQKDDIVIGPNGFVGMINISYKYTSLVKLSIEKMPIEIENKNTYGIINSYEDGYLIVKDINNYSDVEEGDKVIIPGKNILVGWVEKIKLDSLNISKTLYIKLAEDINNISVVGVLR